MGGRILEELLVKGTVLRLGMLFARILGTCVVIMSFFTCFISFMSISSSGVSFLNLPMSMSFCLHLSLARISKKLISLSSSNEESKLEHNDSSLEEGGLGICVSFFENSR